MAFALRAKQRNQVGEARSVASRRSQEGVQQASVWTGAFCFRCALLSLRGVVEVIRMAAEPSLSNARFWHEADIQLAPVNVRYWG